MKRPSYLEDPGQNKSIINIKYNVYYQLHCHMVQFSFLSSSRGMPIVMKSQSTRRKFPVNLEWTTLFKLLIINLVPTILQKQKISCWCPNWCWEEWVMGSVCSQYGETAWMAEQTAICTNSSFQGYLGYLNLYIFQALIGLPYSDLPLTQNSPFWQILYENCIEVNSHQLVLQN